MLTHRGSRDYPTCICIGFTTPRVSCSQYGNIMTAHNSLNCYYTLLGLPHTLACALWNCKDRPGCARHSTCCTHNLVCLYLSSRPLNIYNCMCPNSCSSTAPVQYGTNNRIFVCMQVCTWSSAYLLIITH